jgi:hypothetical protein
MSFPPTPPERGRRIPLSSARGMSFPPTPPERGPAHAPPSLRTGTNVTHTKAIEKSMRLKHTSAHMYGTFLKASQSNEQSDASNSFHQLRS